MNTVVAKVVGVKVEGVPERCVVQEAADFLACKEIHACIPYVMRQDKIMAAIKAHHAKKERCFVYIITKKEGLQYTPIGFVVSKDVNEFSNAKADERFVSYMNSYDTEFMLPVYICCIGHPEFFATIIGQPWMDQGEILRRLKK
jgi:hypothetical protein